MSKEAEEFFRHKKADEQLNLGTMQITKRKTDTGYIVEIRYTLNGVKNKKAILIDCDQAPDHKLL